MTSPALSSASVPRFGAIRSACNEQCLTRGQKHFVNNVVHAMSHGQGPGGRALLNAAEQAGVDLDFYADRQKYNNQIDIYISAVDRTNDKGIIPSYQMGHDSRLAKRMRFRVTCDKDPKKLARELFNEVAVNLGTLIAERLSGKHY